MNKGVREAAAVAAAGVGVLRKVGSNARRGDGIGPHGRADEWRTVTIYRPQEEVAPGGLLPGPLAELGDQIETSVRPAPGDKGTEVAARLRPSTADGAGADGDADGSTDGEGPTQELRSALRRAKQVLEVGEVLSIDGQPAGERTPTPTGKLVEAAAKRAGSEGLR